MANQFLSPGSVVVVSSNQVSSDLGGEVVILGFKNSFYYGLNKSATRIWQLLQEPTTVGEVLEILMEEYEVGRDRCEADLLELLDGLSARGLIEIGTGNQA